MNIHMICAALPSFHSLVDFNFREEQGLVEAWNQADLPRGFLVCLVSMRVASSRHTRLRHLVSDRHRTH